MIYLLIIYIFSLAATDTSVISTPAPIAPTSPTPTPIPTPTPTPSAQRQYKDYIDITTIPKNAKSQYNVTEKINSAIKRLSECEK